jgi:heme exporter protein D
MTNTISLIAAIISLIVTIIGLIKSIKNRRQADKEIINSIRRSLKSQKNQLKYPPF